MLCSWAYRKLRLANVNTAGISRASLTSSQIVLSLLEARRLSRGEVLQTRVPKGHDPWIAIG